MCSMNKWMRMTAVLGTVLGAFYVFPTQAAPPAGGGGSAPSGQIYFTQNPPLGSNSAGVTGLWSMDTDGSGKTLLPYQPRLYGSAQLSNLVHQGHRWFLEFRSSPTPGNGVGVFAVRDDGDPAYSVLLADPSNLSLGHVRWGKDDSLISFAAMPEITSPEGWRSYDPNALARLYTAKVAFNLDTGLPSLTTSLVVVAEGEQLGQADIQNHDWSPSGAKVVYQVSGNPGPTSVRIADVESGTTSLFAASAWTPSWSPDGARIAFKLFNDGIYVANPDGTGLVQITRNSLDVSPGWSPDSKYILFDRKLIKNVKGIYQESADVLRVPAAGGTVFNLTKDIDGYDTAKHWRMAASPATVSANAVPEPATFASFLLAAIGLVGLTRIRPAAEIPFLTGRSAQKRLHFGLRRVL